MGSDFYDFIPFNNEQIGIVIGNVSGKGVSAALYMARLMSDFWFAAQMNPDPENVMQTVNSVLAERSRRGMFASAIYSLLDMGNGLM